MSEGQFRNRFHDCAVGDYVMQQNGDPDSNYLLVLPPPAPITCENLAESATVPDKNESTGPWRFQLNMLTGRGEKIKLWRRVE